MMDIKSLLPWSEPKRVDTKNGERLLHTAAPNDKFWTVWRQQKDQLKSAGISCAKNESGVWQVCWWQQISAEQREKELQALEQSFKASSDFDAPAPNGLAYLPYQLAGIEYASRFENCLIADEMGLGKTIQAIGVINSDEMIDNILIVCPASLKLNWQNELHKWLTGNLTVGIVTSKQWSATNIKIINYEILGKHQYNICTGFDLIIFDEAQYLKNPKSQRTQNALDIPARRTIFLTGTPILNRPIELFPMLTKIDPQGLGKSFFSFAKRYCDATYGDYGWDFSGASNLKELQERLRSRGMIRRLKSDVLTELPDKRRQIIALELPKSTRKLIEEEKKIVEKFNINFDDAEVLEQGYGGASIGELARIRQEIALAKVPFVVEHVKESLEQGPVVLMCYHQAVAEKLAGEFLNNCVMVHGGVPAEERHSAVSLFQTGMVDLFIGTIRAAGVGITLTRSSHVVFAELDWVPGNISQAEDRCHRIGQKNSVLIQHLIFNESLDVTLVQTLIAKQEVIKGAVG